MTGSSGAMPAFAGRGDLSARGHTRRTEIVAAAVDVFAEHGYDGASLRQVADAIGTTKGHLTYYFAVKDDLLFEIVVGLHDAFVDLAATWMEAAEPADALRHAFTEHVRLVCERLPAVRVSYEAFRYLTSDRRAIVVGKRDRYEAALTALIDRHRPPGPEPYAGVLRARAVLGMLNWPYQWYSPGGPVTVTRLADAIADMALHSLDR